MKTALLQAMLAIAILVAGWNQYTGSNNATASGTAAQSGLWAVGYYPAWQSAMPISSIPFTSMTHAVFFAIVPAHRVGTGNFTQTVGSPGTLIDPMGLMRRSAAFVSAAHHAGVKALLGVGGDASVDAPLGFQQAMQSPSTMNDLVNNIVTAMARDGYDGVDINWEAINFPADVATFQAFITQLRSSLDQQSPRIHYLLTYPAGPASDPLNDTNYANMILPVQGAIDQINLQTYSMAGAYPGWVTWHNSALYSGTCIFPQTAKPLPSVDGSIQAYASAGILNRKLGIGIQLAGVDWAGGYGTTTGGVTKPCQSWDYTNGNQGAPVVTYLPASTVIARYTAGNGYLENFDNATMTSWLSKNQPDNANDHFVSFENSQSIQAKADYIKRQGLGGAIIFEVSGDYMPNMPAGDAQHPLMTAVRQYIIR